MKTKTKTKIKNKVVGLFCLLFVVSTYMLGQQQLQPSTNTFEYKNAIGIRAGETSGITFKHKFGGGNAFEGILSFWPYTMGVTGLYEKNFKTNAQGLNWYIGAGGHVNMGSARYKAYYWRRGYEYVYVRRTSELALGIDGILGLEYKFKPIPLAISADIKPYIETSTYSYTYFTLDPGIGLKLTF